MSAETIGQLAGRVVNQVAGQTGRVRQFPERENEMNAVATVEGRTPMDLLSQAIEKGAALDVISQFMDLQERHEKNLARRAFDLAISEAKAEIPIIAKNRTGHNDKRYADFAALASVVDPIISQHGLSYRFRTMQDEKLIRVSCILSHSAGHSEEHTLAGPADASGSKNAIQAIGSTLTYLQRYSLTQALGLAVAEDDDGKAAADGGPISQEQKVNILNIAEEVGADLARFCKYMKVESVPDIPAKDYDRAVSVLQQKAKKR